MKAKKLYQKRLEFLYDTIDYFNSDNRSVKKEYGEISSTCVYCPPEDSNSEGCAIGRHLDPFLAQELDREDDASVENIYIFERLPKKLRKLGREFLFVMQVLHDMPENWNKKGLNRKGKNAAEGIYQTFCKE